MSTLVKICGMRQAENIKDVASLQPDFMGFIFYKASPRFVDKTTLKQSLTVLHGSTSKVAVFVNEKVEDVVQTCLEFGIKAVQLHGQETPAECDELRKKGLTVIKAFPIGGAFDQNQLLPYVPFVDYFLFDTKTPSYGGSGKKFNWQLLKDYSLAVPYLLSGGIGPTDIDSIMEMKLPGMVGIDANSHLELSSGIKDLGKTKELIWKIRNN